VYAPGFAQPGIQSNLGWESIKRRTRGGVKHTIRDFVGALMMVLFASPGLAQKRYVPKLDSKVPSYVLKARVDSQQCLTDTDTGHRDPCALVAIQKRHFTIAWDAKTNEITYLFTDDRNLIMDSELSVGGLCRLVEQDGKPVEVVQYMGWLITGAWTDMARDVSADAYWFAALRRDVAYPEYGRIIGFVQSRYLKVSQ
jgi:hypothetical protein